MEVFVLPPWWLNPGVGGNKNKPGNRNKEIQMIRSALLKTNRMKSLSPHSTCARCARGWNVPYVSAVWVYCRCVHQHQLYLFVFHFQVSVILAQRHNKLTGCCWERSHPLKKYYISKPSLTYRQATASSVVREKMRIKVDILIKRTTYLVCCRLFKRCLINSTLLWHQSLWCA